MSNQTNEPDNLEAAIAQVAASIEPTIHRSTGATDTDPIQQVLIRAPRSSHQRWKQAAELLGISLAEYVRRLCDARASELLDCPHNPENIKHNRWGKYCNRCGQQLVQRR